MIDGGLALAQILFPDAGLLEMITVGWRHQSVAQKRLEKGGFPDIAAASSRRRRP
jgi:hypothetical protein